MTGKPSKSGGTGLPRQVSRDMTARTGKPGQDRKTGPGQASRARTGKPGQDRQARPGQAYRTTYTRARTGKSRLDSQNMTA